MFRTRKTLFFPHFSAKSPLAAVFVTRLNLGKDEACAADTQSVPRRSFPARFAAADRLLMNLRWQKNRRQSGAVPGAGGVRDCPLPVCLTLLWVQPIPPPPSSAVPLKPLISCSLLCFSVDNFQTLRKKSHERTAAAAGWEGRAYLCCLQGHSGTLTTIVSLKRGTFFSTSAIQINIWIHTKKKNNFLHSEGKRIQTLHRLQQLIIGTNFLLHPNFWKGQKSRNVPKRIYLLSIWNINNISI